ncbi:MAG TPA: A/G-specific adenine glycosylase [Gammaproteobacteria bacterium]|jgi:A/G-specific adenine glycosylase|nr:A/G-specific adenine glycosylase [Gammaproteobacteria bacterium]
MKSLSPKQFQSLILKWCDQHGRKNLPWQKNKTPYRVWLSEIMLQQTQVATVIPYFNRFIRQFPSVAMLAKAAEDEILHLWTGLGYYSRARNLLRAAKMVMKEFQGRFPDNIEDLQQLPGIGPSTAGAILALGYEYQATILDGNVKRVLARLHGITDPINEKQTENQLWEIAKQYTPIQRIADYTQTMMDLGATICTRGKPQCDHCPLIDYCIAYQQNIAASLPVKTKARPIPTRTATFLLIKNRDTFLLSKRPPSGIWGGLWSFPEMPNTVNNKTIIDFCKEEWHIKPTKITPLLPFRHTFTHFHLMMQPVLVCIKKQPAAKIMTAKQQIWYNPAEPDAIGLPAPIRNLLAQQADETT